jgi:hypothetical protein
VVRLKLTVIREEKLEGKLDCRNVPSPIGEYLGLEPTLPIYPLLLETYAKEAVKKLTLGDTYYLLTEDELLAILSP